MLSYQHAYHAGNAADVHKHALLAWMLDYMTAKDKPLSYLESHAGRGLYDLDSAEARKTGEAAAGIERSLTAGWFQTDHPYFRALRAIRATHGASAYGGSPLLAAALLRPTDRITLAELHGQEHAALSAAMAGRGADIRQADGYAMALSLCPPTPRRGLLLIDPSWEVKADYVEMPKRLTALHRKWSVGVIALWYPILKDAHHAPMLAACTAAFPDALCSEVRFQVAREGHAMTGSGLFVINPPWGLAAEASRLADLFSR